MGLASLARVNLVIAAFQCPQSAVHGLIDELGAVPSRDGVARLLLGKFKALVLRECPTRDVFVRQGRDRSVVLQPLGAQENVPDCPKSFFNQER